MIRQCAIYHTVRICIGSSLNFLCNRIRSCATQYSLISVTVCLKLHSQSFMVNLCFCDCLAPTLGHIRTVKLQIKLCRVRRTVKREIFLIIPRVPYGSTPALAANAGIESMVSRQRIARMIENNLFMLYASLIYRVDVVIKLQTSSEHGSQQRTVSSLPLPPLFDHWNHLCLSHKNSTAEVSAELSVLDTFCSLSISLLNFQGKRF